MSWENYMFNDINKKSNPVTSLAPCTDEEITERISASTSSYMTELNENTFKPARSLKVFTIRPRFLYLTELYWQAPNVVVKVLCGANTTA